MEQLLEMRTTPIKLEWRVQHARYEIKTTPSSSGTQKSPNSLTAASKSRRLLDTYAAKSSTEPKSVAVSAHQNTDNATANHAEEGDTMNDYPYDAAMADIASQWTNASIETASEFSPSVPVNINWEPQDLSMRYEMDKLNFEWHTNQTAEIEYIPSKIECYIAAYPKVEFTYVGKPLYVPPSASPEYEEQNFDMLV